MSAPHHIWRQIAAVGALLALASVVAVGCGSGSGGKPTGPLSKSALASKANKLCKGTRTKLDALGPQAQLPARQKFVQRLHDDLASLRARVRPANRRDFAAIVTAAKGQAKLSEADEKVRAAAPQYESISFPDSLPAEVLALLHDRNTAYAAMKIQAAEDAAVRLGAKSCVNTEVGVPAQAPLAKDATTASVLVDCASLGRLAVYSRISANLPASDLLTRVDCGSTLKVLASDPWARWFHVETPDGQQGWAQPSVYFTPQDPNSTAAGTCKKPFEDNASALMHASALMLLVGYDASHYDPSVTMVGSAADPPKTLFECSGAAGGNNQVSCIHCLRVPVREFAQPNGKLPDFTVSIPTPTVGATSTGCTFSVVVANQGKGWGPNTFELLTKQPGSRQVETLGAWLGVPPGFSYESEGEFGVDIGISLSGPFVVTVDPANKVRESDEHNNTARYSNPSIACNVG